MTLEWVLTCLNGFYFHMFHKLISRADKAKGISLEGFYSHTSYTLMIIQCVKHQLTDFQFMLMIHSLIQREIICTTVLPIVYINIVQIHHKLPVLRNDEL